LTENLFFSIALKQYKCLCVYFHSRKDHGRNSSLPGALVLCRVFTRFTFVVVLCRISSRLKIALFCSLQTLRGEHQTQVHVLIHQIFIDYHCCQFIALWYFFRQCFFRGFPRQIRAAHERARCMYNECHRLRSETNVKMHEQLN
jgi:hypothetical protein